MKHHAKYTEMLDGSVLHHAFQCDLHHDAYLGMALDHTVLAHIHAMLVAELIGDITFRTLAEPHGDGCWTRIPWYVVKTKVRLCLQNP